MSGGEFSEPRLLHSPGFIDLCLNKAKDKCSTAFISSGTDGDVWLWNEDILDDAEYEPKSVRGRTHHSVAWHGENVYVGHTLADARTGVEKAVVSRFSIVDFVSSAPLCSFSLDVTSIDISPDGTVLAVGALDHVVKVIKVESGNYARLECEGQIMCVRIDPKGELLAVSASDGTITMYSLSLETGNSPLRSARISSRIPDIDVREPRLQICWTTDGTYLFVVTLGGLKRFIRDAFDDSSTFIAPSAATEMFTACCISSCDKFIAASSMAGTICVWNAESGNLLSCSKYVRNGEAKVITSMIWHPTIEATLFFADCQEHICSLSNCTREINTEQEEASSNKKKLIIDSDDDTRLSADLGAIKRSYGFDDDGLFASEKNPPSDQPLFVPTKVLEPVASYEPPRVPKPFVSGSSPAHLSQRYLKWNQFGIVISYSTTEENTIEVRWHDVSVHSDIVIENTLSRYSVADLSNELLALASQMDTEAASELRVQCINVWDAGSREWTAQMPSDESVDIVAVGNCFVAVATSLRFIRFFSHAGTQIMLLSHPGPILTMCAAGKRLTTVALSGGYFFEDDKPQFNMAANTYEVIAGRWFKKESIFDSVSLALSPNASLEWIGYSKDCVRLLTENGVWVPICSFASSLKSSLDHVFLVGVVEYPHPELRYVYCKGTHYPPVASRLVPLVAPWNVPLCSPESEKSQLEAKLFHSELFRCAFERPVDSGVIDIQELCAAYAKDVMRLFALACKADRECRAAELACYAPAAHIIQSMCNFAAKTRHPLLVEKIAEIGRNSTYLTKTMSALDQRSVNDDGEENLMPKPVVRRFHSAKRKMAEEEEEDEQKGANGDGEEEESVDVSHVDTSLGSEPSSFIYFSAVKTAPNPFKRRAQPLNDSQENIFDSLSSSTLRTTLHTHSGDSIKNKKSKHEVTSQQSLLRFSTPKSTAKSSQVAECKTGFVLWLNSVEAELRSQYEGSDEEFMKMATRQFKQLAAEEKKRWNELARGSSIS